MSSRIEHARFETTRWTLVLQARHTGAAAEQAMNEVCRIYWSPLYAYSRSWGRSRAESEDVVQSFFLTALRRGLFAQANPEKGRLRSLLLTAFKRHLQDHSDREAAACRSPGTPVEWNGLDELEERLPPLPPGHDPQEAFDREWAHTVLDQSLRLLEERYHQENKADLFSALRSFLVHTDDPPARDAMAARLDMSPSALGVAIHRMRKRYRESIRSVIARTVDRDEDIESEFQALAAVLSHSGL